MDSGVKINHRDSTSSGQVILFFCPNSKTGSPLKSAFSSFRDRILHVFWLRKKGSGRSQQVATLAVMELYCSLSINWAFQFQITIFLWLNLPAHFLMEANSSKYTHVLPMIAILGLSMGWASSSILTMELYRWAITKTSQYANLGVNSMERKVLKKEISRVRRWSIKGSGLWVEFSRFIRTFIRNRFILWTNTLIQRQRWFGR